MKRYGQTKIALTAFIALFAFCTAAQAAMVRKSEKALAAVHRYANMTIGYKPAAGSVVEERLALLDSGHIIKEVYRATDVRSMAPYGEGYRFTPQLAEVEDLAQLSAAEMKPLRDAVNGLNSTKSLAKLMQVKSTYSRVCPSTQKIAFSDNLSVYKSGLRYTKTIDGVLTQIYYTSTSNQTVFDDICGYSLVEKNTKRKTQADVILDAIEKATR